MDDNPWKPVLLEPATGPREATALPWVGLLLGAAVGFFLVHPISMVVRAAHESIYAGAPLDLGPVLLRSFQVRMWPMMALYTLLGALLGAILGFVLQRLKENRRRLDTLHEEFELQVAALRHHYKNLAIGIRGFSSRVRRKLESLEKHLKQFATDDSAVHQEYEALAHDVEILEETSQRLTQSLGQELFFLKALTSSSLSPNSRDIFPLLIQAISDLLKLRFREKEILVEINGQPWEKCQESLVFPFEPYSMEVILQNILSNAMKLSNFIQVEVSERNGWVRVSIHDNGPGFEVAKLRQSLLAPSDRQSAESTHLGLKVSLHLMAKIGGRISVASNLGEGALFVLDIPRELPIPQTL